MVFLRFALFHCAYLISITSCIEVSPTVKLSSGYEMPVIGFNMRMTHHDASDYVYNAVMAALLSGYKHLDMTTDVKIERTVAQVLKAFFHFGGKREDLFITAQLPMISMKPWEVQHYLRSSLSRMELQYFDLYMIGEPFDVLGFDHGSKLTIKGDMTVIFDDKMDHVGIWKALEAEVKSGRVRSIGLNDFNQTQIQNIIDHAEIMPAVLRGEFHAYMQQKSLRNFCERNNISVMAYAPHGGYMYRKMWYPKQKTIPDLFEHPVILDMANETCRPPSQIILRHLLQKGISVMSSSRKPDHVVENGKVFDFELYDDEMEKIDALEIGPSARVFTFKVYLGIEKHHYYPWPESI
ncbi:hypothetical protein QAD02_006249 [Eretmocerus hayati]|uniref:Uncharacterized protein n=1 Tax=Eretmocerus hayati TaxID=131215 RepID=A0ACC2N2N1_9HYME|nr:hypothetical protein QAD02_006249 [Eretmocerus hayati]